MRSFQKQLLALMWFNLLFFTACETDKRPLNQGIIQYEIKYLDSEKENPLITLLPETMSLSFKDNNTIIKIEGYLGLFSFAYITNAKKDKNSTLLKIIDKKYLYQISNGYPSYGYDELMLDYTVKHCTEVKDILGYRCKKATFEFKNPKISPIDVFYTNEIAIEKPNRNNPFKELDGVLLEFQVRLNNINMRFKAIKIWEAEISDDLFEVPDGFEKISKEMMQDKMKNYNAS